MKKYYVILTLLALSGLTACGGGSEEGAAESEAPAPVAQPTDTGTDNDTANTTTSASDIAVPTGFDFSTNKVLPIMVSVNSSFPAKMYLTVCHMLPQTAGNAAQPDLNSCLTRTPVINGQYEGETLLPNDVETLAATLWSFDPAGEISTYTWTRGDGPIPELLIAE